MCAGLLCAMHPRWQTQADCDAFRVFYCHSLRCQHVRLWSRCRPCLKHLRCGLACEVKQTALDEIRVRWAWLVTNQQPALACSSLWHRLPTLGQTKRELALRFASSTYFISAGSIKESLIHRGRLRFSILMMLVECCCQFTEKKKPLTWITGVPASVGPPRQTVSFLFVFPVLPLHQRMGLELWAGCQVKSSVMTMY